MNTPLPIIGNKLLQRTQNKNLQHRVLDMTPENKKLLRDYEQLAKEINDIPARMRGLRMNYRKRDIPMAYAALAVEREQKMQKLLEMEKTLFPKDT